MAMTVDAGRAAVKLALDDREYTRGIKSAQKKLRSMASGMERIGARMVAVGTSIGAALGVAVKTASTAEQTLSRFGYMMGGIASETDKAAGNIDKFGYKVGSLASRMGAEADRIGKMVGRSKLTVMDAMAVFQGFFKGLEFGSEQSAKLSTTLAKLTLDFASIHNVADQQGIERFLSGLSGISRALQRYGINIKQARLELELQNLGLADSVQAATEAEKAVARLSLIYRSMEDQNALGNAVDTAHEFANVMKRLGGRIRDFSVAIGGVLMPVLADLGKVLSKLLGQWTKMEDVLRRGVAFVAAVAVGFVGVGTVLIGLGLIFQAVAIAFGGFVKVFRLLVSPITLVTKTFSGLVAGISATQSALTGLGSAFSGLRVVMVGVRMRVVWLIEDLWSLGKGAAAAAAGGVKWLAEGLWEAGKAAAGAAYSLGATLVGALRRFIASVINMRIVTEAAASVKLLFVFIGDAARFMAVEVRTAAGALVQNMIWAFKNISMLGFAGVFDTIVISARLSFLHVAESAQFAAQELKRAFGTIWFSLTSLARLTWSKAVMMKDAFVATGKAAWDMAKVAALASWSAAKTVSLAAGSMVKTVAIAAKGLVGEIIWAFTNIMRLGIAVAFQHIAGTIIWSFMRIQVGARTMWLTVKPVFAWIIGGLADVAGAAIAAGKALVLHLGTALSYVAAGVKRAAAAIWATLIPALAALANAAKTAAGALVKTLVAALLATAKAVVVGAFSALLAIFTTILPIIAAVAGAFLLLAVVSGIVVGSARALIKTGLSLSQIWDLVTVRVRDLWNAFKNVFPKMGGAVESFAGQLASSFMVAVSYVGGLMGRLWGFITKVFSGIVKALRAGEFKLAMQIAWLGLKTAAIEGGKELLSLTSEVWHTIMLVGAKAFAGLRKAWNVTVTFFKKAATWARKEVLTEWEKMKMGAVEVKFLVTATSSEREEWESFLSKKTAFEDLSEKVKKHARKMRKGLDAQKALAKYARKSNDALNAEQKAQSDEIEADYAEQRDKIVDGADFMQKAIAKMGGKTKKELEAALKKAQDIDPSELTTKEDVVDWIKNLLGLDMDEIEFPGMDEAEMEVGGLSKTFGTFSDDLSGIGPPQTHPLVRIAEAVRDKMEEAADEAERVINPRGRIETEQGVAKWPGPQEDKPYARIETEEGVFEWDEPPEPVEGQRTRIETEEGVFEWEGPGGPDRGPNRIETEATIFEWGSPFEMMPNIFGFEEQAQDAIRQLGGLPSMIPEIITRTTDKIPPPPADMGEQSYNRMKSGLESKDAEGGRDKDIEKNTARTAEVLETIERRGGLTFT